MIVLSNLISFNHVFLFWRQIKDLWSDHAHPLFHATFFTYVRAFCVVFPITVKPSSCPFTFPSVTFPISSFRLDRCVNQLAFSSLRYFIIYFAPCLIPYHLISYLICQLSYSAFSFRSTFRSFADNSSPYTESTPHKICAFMVCHALARFARYHFTNRILQTKGNFNSLFSLRYKWCV